MKIKLAAAVLVTVFASLLVAISAFLSAPAFASGYGPAPFYDTSAGAPASQRGQSVQTLDAAGTRQEYGGAPDGHSESAARAAVTPRDNVYAHR
jgi:hypothetical protein